MRFTPDTSGTRANAETTFGERHPTFMMESQAGQPPAECRRIHDACANPLAPGPAPGPAPVLSRGIFEGAARGAVPALRARVGLYDGNGMVRRKAGQRRSVWPFFAW